MARRRDNLEYKVLQVVKKHGEKGILQSSLWKEMKATSREGSRISLKLERGGLIERKRELHDGKWTYVLIANKRPVKLNQILELPCVFCISQEKCGVGTAISPNNCVEMTAWVSKTA